MKKTTYITGYIAAFAAVIATVFKINHLSYTGVIVAIAWTLMSIYFYFFILDKMGDSSGGKILLVNLVAAFCATFIDIGILFKLEHWPLAGLLITIGLAGFTLVFLPMLYFQKSKQTGANNLMNGAGAVGLALFALGVLTKIQHWPGQIPLFIAGAALVFIVYFPMFMMNKTIPDEKKINHLRDTFFTIIIGCLILLFAWGMIGRKLLTPEEGPVTTEQSK
ncbi:MAG: hypothetical protein NTW82_02405 [Bacteroidia bacterium]|nr:hypothetical protein [Bacteroidia bacterium]